MFHHGKDWEKEIAERSGVKINPRYSPVQFHFTEGYTPSTAVYSLVGAGLYGLNCVGSRVSSHMIITYITPMQYGLEALILQDPDYEIIESYCRYILKQMQDLHSKHSYTSSVQYLLVGCVF